MLALFRTDFVAAASCATKVRNSSARVSSGLDGTYCAACRRDDIRSNIASARWRGRRRDTRLELDLAIVCVHPHHDHNIGHTQGDSDVISSYHIYVCQLFSRHDVGLAVRNVCYCGITFFSKLAATLRWFRAGGAIRIALRQLSQTWKLRHYDVTDDVITRKL